PLPGRAHRAHPGEPRRPRDGSRLMEFLLQLVINGLVVGCIYSLVALGFVIIYKSSGILNFAQGEFLLLGAYVFLAIVAQANVPVIPALLLTFAFATLLGLALERVVLRPLIGEPIISVIMVTLGLSSILRAIVQGIWGTDTRPMHEVFSLEPIQIGPLPVARGYLYSAASVAVLLVALTLFFKYARPGIAMRATAASQQVALSMGISVRRIFALSWSIAAVVSAFGRVLIAFMVALFSITFVAGSYWLDVANRAAIAVIAATGLNILTGFTGQISLGNAAFLAVGAYTTAFLSSHGMPFLVACPASGIATALAGMVFGIPSLRLKGLYLAMATLAAHFIVEFT